MSLRYNNTVTVCENGEFETTSGGSVEPPLRTKANYVGNCSATSGNDEAEKALQRALDARAKRWRWQELLWELSALDRVRACRRFAVGVKGRSKAADNGNNVQVRRSQDSSAVGYAGLSTCGSVWACPTCSSRIQARRRIELGCLLTMAADEGYSALFTTYTLRHHSKQKLALLWGSLSKAFRRVAQDKGVQNARKSVEDAGYVRAVEVTHGSYGWHPHIHCIRLVKGDCTEQEAQLLGDTEFRAWRAAARHCGLGEPVKDAFDVKLVKLANNEVFIDTLTDYVTKTGAAGAALADVNSSSNKQIDGLTYELASHSTKRARKVGNKTPTELLQEFAETGNVYYLDLWNEYEIASHGKRALTWSRGLKRDYGIKDATDEAIAAETMGSQKDTVFEICDWSAVARQPGLAAEILNTLQRHGVTEAIDLCFDRNVPIVAV